MQACADTVLAILQTPTPFTPAIELLIANEKRCHFEGGISFEDDVLALQVQLQSRQC
jgi:hypothetical protein